jgi:hypothetical protein
MSTPSARKVFDDPTGHWEFITQDSDNHFEGQHFDRKEACQAGADAVTQKIQLRSGSRRDQRNDISICK